MELKSSNRNARASVFPVPKKEMILGITRRTVLLGITFVISVGLYTHVSAQDRPNTPEGQPNRAQAPRRIHRGMTVDDQLKALTQRLALDSTQQSMVKIILQRCQVELLDVYKNDALSAVDRFNLMKAVHEKANDRIARLLNPEQSKKFDLMRNHTPAQSLPKPEAATPPKS
jgi:hypothetical protein